MIGSAAPAAGLPAPQRDPPSPLRLPGAGWLALVVVVTRAAGLLLGPLNLDECELLVVGRVLGEGGLPYVAFAEKKPLLGYLFYAPAAWVGYRMWPMQLLAMAWVVATALVVGRAARAWTGRADVGRAAAWLACLAQVACVPAVNLETLLNLPAALALLGYVRAQRSGRLRDALVTGLWIGVATLFKQQAGILLVAFALALALASRPGAPRALPVAGLLIGTGLPWAAAAGLYAALGHLPEFWEWNVLRNVRYSAHGAGSAAARLAGGIAIGIALAAPLHWYLAVRESLRVLRDRRREPVAVGLTAALWLTAIPVSLGGRFYDHYFLQFAPPLSLLAAPGAVRLLEGWRRLGRRARALAAGAVVAPLLLFLGLPYALGARGALPLQEHRTRELAAWLRRHTRPEDRLFVWGDYAPVYVLADRLPGTRYYTTALHVGDFDPHHLPEGFDLRPHVSARDVALTLRDLEANRPAYVVDTAPSDIHEWHHVPLAVVPALRRYVDEHYAPVAVAGGAQVYRRR